MKKLTFVGIAFCVLAGGLYATDVINQDNKKYTVRVQGEGKLSISDHVVNANGSVYGLCGYDFCTFEIPGSKVEAKKGDRLTISGGKFSK